MASVPRVRFAAPFRATSGSARWRFGRRPGFGPRPRPRPRGAFVLASVLLARGFSGVASPSRGTRRRRGATPVPSSGPRFVRASATSDASSSGVSDDPDDAPTRIDRPTGYSHGDEIDAFVIDEKERVAWWTSHGAVPEKKRFRWPPSLGHGAVPRLARAAWALVAVAGVARAASVVCASILFLPRSPPRDRRRRPSPPPSTPRSAPPSALWPRARSPGSSSPPRPPRARRSCARRSWLAPWRPSLPLSRGRRRRRRRGRRAARRAAGSDRRGEGPPPALREAQAEPPRREAREARRGRARGRDVDEEAGRRADRGRRVRRRRVRRPRRRRFSPIFADGGARRRRRVAPGARRRRRLRRARGVPRPPAASEGARDGFDRGARLPDAAARRRDFEGGGEGGGGAGGGVPARPAPRHLLVPVARGRVRGARGEEQDQRG